MSEKYYQFNRGPISSIDKQSDGWCCIVLSADDFTMGSGEAEKLQIKLSKGSTTASSYCIDSLAGQAILTTDEPINYLLGNLSINGLITDEQMHSAYKAIGLPKHTANLRKHTSSENIHR